MTRTQIYLHDNLFNDLRTGAKLKKISVSEYIRQLLSEKLTSQAKDRNSNPLLQLARRAKKASSSGKKTNIAGNFDKYLPREWR